MIKQLRTEAELATVIMQEVRKHDDCEHISSVAITRLTTNRPEDRNWDVAWIRNGSKTAPETARQIAERFQSEFQLAT